MIRSKNKRYVIKLEAISLNVNDKKYLSLIESEMKDVKKGDTFIMLEGSMELVMGKNDKFLWKAKSDAIPHKDSFIIQAEEI